MKIILFIFFSTVLASGSGAQEMLQNCPVHNVPMSYVNLPYKRTGELTREQVEEEKVSEALFPYGRDFTPAGCFGGEGLGDEPAGFLCSSCVEARADWLAEFSAKNKE